MPELDRVLAPKILSTSVDFDGETLEFSFDAKKVTPRWFGEQQRLLEEQDVNAIAKAMAEILTGWNLTIAEVPAEISVDTLALFPISHLMAMMEATVSLPSRAEGEDSREPSPGPSTDSTASPPTPQNGAATSVSPAPSESLSAT
jgi:hypothetical protein